MFTCDLLYSYTAIPKVDLVAIGMRMLSATAKKCLRQVYGALFYVAEFTERIQKRPATKQSVVNSRENERPKGVQERRRRR